MSVSDLEVYKAVVMETFHSDSFLLGIVDSDSAVVYYKVSQGLVPPERPEELEAKKQKRLRYRERRKHRHMKYSQIADAVSIKSGFASKVSPKGVPPSASHSQFPCSSATALESDDSVPRMAGKLHGSRTTETTNPLNSQLGTMDTEASTSTEFYSQVNSLKTRVPCPTEHTSRKSSEKSSSLFDGLNYNFTKSEPNRLNLTGQKTTENDIQKMGESEIHSEKLSSLFDDFIKVPTSEIPAKLGSEFLVAKPEASKVTNSVMVEDRNKIHLKKCDCDNAAGDFKNLEGESTKSAQSKDSSRVVSPSYLNQKFEETTECHPLRKEDITRGQLTKAKLTNYRNSHQVELSLPGVRVEGQSQDVSSNLIGGEILDMNLDEDVSSDFISHEGSVDRTQEEDEELEAVHSVPNMAPEDFEDVEYTDEFEGEM